MKKVFLLLTFIPLLSLASPIRILNWDKSRFPEITVKFRFSEEGEEKVSVDQKKLNLFWNGENIPYSLDREKRKQNVSTLVLIDASGSLKNLQRTEIKSTTRSFIEKMQPGDEAAVYAFHDKPVRLSDFTGNRRELIRAVGTLQRGGRYTRLYDALIFASKYLEKNAENKKKAIVILSDGHDERSKNSIDKAIDAAKKRKIPVYSMGFTSGSPRYFNSLIRISNATGGLFSLKNSRNLASRILGIEKKIYQLRFTVEQGKPQNTLLITSGGMEKKVSMDLNAGELEKLKKEKELSLPFIIGGASIVLLLILLVFILLISRKKKRQKVRFSGNEKETVSRMLVGFIKENPYSRVRKILTEKKINALNLLDILENLKKFRKEERDALDSTISKTRQMAEDRAVLVSCFFRPFYQKTLEKVLHEGKTGPSSELPHESRELLKKFEREVTAEKDNLIEAGLYPERIRAGRFFESFLDTISTADPAKRFRELLKWQPGDITRMFPLMIQIFKDAEGMDRENRFSLLKNMATGLNYEGDISDIRDWENWWKRNKKNILKEMEREEEKELDKGEERGTFFDELFFYACHQGNLLKIRAKVVSLERNRCSVRTEIPLYLEEVLCCYLPEADVPDQTLYFQQMTFLKLMEIAQAEESLYELELSFLKNTEKEDPGVIRLLKLFD
jgi:hypothetical protein